ncbi:hypothetical protein IFR05_010640 [Cadophora sp. M221]|nr:hypothetical protein IFR05_010640 [Cadophora sp. M221]
MAKPMDGDAEAEGKSAVPSSSKAFSPSNPESDKKLLSAARKKETPKPEIEDYLKRDANINVRDEIDGRTPLHIACREGDEMLTVVEALLNLDADVNAQDKNDEETPLGIAAFRGFGKIVKVLLEHGAEYNKKNKKHQRTPFHLAIRYGHLSIVQALIEESSRRLKINGEGLKLNITDKYGKTPLHLAVGDKEKLGFVQALFIDSTQWPNVDVQDDEGNTPLHTAATNGLEEVTKILLKHGAHLDLRDKLNDRNPLHLAVRHGHLAIVQAMFDSSQRPGPDAKGPDINSKDKLGLTPLHIAARDGNNSIVTTLLEHHPEVTAVDKDGDTPLHLAGRNGHSDVVETLLLKDSKSVVNMKNENDETPLHHAVKNREKGKEAEVEKIVRALLIGGAHIDSKSKIDGETPLHIAARSKSEGVVRALLSFNLPEDMAKVYSGQTVSGSTEQPLPSKSPPTTRGPTADVNMKNLRGFTPLQIAIRHKNANIVRLMLERVPLKEDLSHTTQAGMADLEFALRNGNVGIATLFLAPSCPMSKEVNKTWLDSYTPLSWAAVEGHLDFAKVLVENGADTKMTGTNGWTALHYASAGGYSEIVQLLLDREADPFARTRAQSETSKGDTPVSLAAAKMHHQVVKVLLNFLRAKTPNNKDSVARFLGYEEITGADRDRYGDDAMQGAADHEETQELVRLVLKQRDTTLLTEGSPRPWGSKILGLQGQINERVRYSTNKHSWDALSWAVYCGQLELTERLLPAHKNTDTLAQEERESAKILANTICEVIHSYLTAAERVEPGLHVNAGLELSDESLYQDMDERRPQSAGSDHFVAKDETHLTSTDEKEFFKTMDRIEEEYLSICDSLLFHGKVPLNPAVVRIADSNKCLPKPTLDEDTRESIDGFFAGIIDIYNDAGGVAFLRRSRRVSSVLYDKGATAIMDSARVPLTSTRVTSEKAQDAEVQNKGRYHKKDLRLRWVHLPANNMQWMEDFVLRLILDNTTDEKLTLERPNGYAGTKDFLWQSYHELPKGGSQVHFMKPKCVKQPKDPKPEYTKEGSSSKGKGKSEAVEKSGRHDKDKKESTHKSPKTDHKSEQKVKSAIPGTPEVLALYMPYLTFGTLTEDEYKPGPDPQTAEPTLSLIPKKESYQELFDTYKGKVVHGSRTLDEFFYNSLSDGDARTDLNQRNIDQVTSKRILDVDNTSDWRIIRIDQLWVWVIDDKTILSSSTHRLDNEEDPVLEEIWKHMTSQEVREGRVALPSSPYEMAKFITDFCIDFFDHSTCPVGLIDESMHEIYRNAINKTSRDEAKLFEKFKRKIDKNILNVESTLATENGKAKKGNDIDAEEKAKQQVKQNGKAKKGNDVDAEEKAKQQVKQNFESIKEASARLKDIKDIRDELNMLKAVLAQQKSVWNELCGITVDTGELKGPAYAINNIVEMDNHAGRVQDAVLSVLELEQNEASMQEAMSSREQAQESIRQGRTLMVFTIVTIFFLPASFLASLFALDISVFPHSGDSLAWPNWAFAVIFGLTLALSAIIIALAFYVGHLKKTIRGISDFLQGLDKASVMAEGTQTEPKPATVDDGESQLVKDYSGKTQSSFGRMRSDSIGAESRMSNASRRIFRGRGKGRDGRSTILPV